MSDAYHYYLPQGAHEFLIWARNFTETAGHHAPAWGLVQADIDDLKAGTDAYAQALQTADADSASKEDIRAKNTLHTALAAKFKDYVNAKLRYNRAVDNDGRAALGLHVPDGAKTPVHTQEQHVGFTVRPIHAREHRIDFYVEETRKKAVPYGCNGAVFFVKALEPGEPVPVSAEDFHQSDLITHTPHIREFPPSDQGKRACYAACWQNNRGEKGPLSDIQVHIVP